MNFVRAFFLIQGRGSWKSNNIEQNRMPQNWNNSKRRGGETTTARVRDKVEGDLERMEMYGGMRVGGWEDRKDRAARKQN